MSVPYSIVQPGTVYFKSHTLPARVEFILNTNGDSSILFATPEVINLLGFQDQDFAASEAEKCGVDLMLSNVIEQDRNALLAQVANDMMIPVGTEESKLFRFRLLYRDTGEIRFAQMYLSHTRIANGLHTFISFEDVTEMRLEVTTTRLVQEHRLVTARLAPRNYLPNESYAGTRFTVFTPPRYVAGKLRALFHVLQPSHQDMRSVQIRHSSQVSSLNDDGLGFQDSTLVTFPPRPPILTSDSYSENLTQQQLFGRSNTHVSVQENQTTTVNANEVYGAFRLPTFEYNNFNAHDDNASCTSPSLASFLLNAFSDGKEFEVSMNGSNKSNHKEEVEEKSPIKTTETRGKKAIGSSSNKTTKSPSSSESTSGTIQVSHISPQEAKKSFQVSALDIRDHEYIDFSLVDDKELPKMNKPCFGNLICEILSDEIKDSELSIVTLNESTKKPRPIRSFPKILYDVLSYGRINNVIKWLPHGRAFIICDGEIFFETIWPLFTKKTTQANFIRQLGFWRFKRITKGMDLGAYFHPLFLRGKPSLVGKILCSKKTTQSSQILQDPDFYSLEKKRPLPELSEQDVIKNLPALKLKP